MDEPIEFTYEQRCVFFRRFVEEATSEMIVMLDGPQGDGFTCNEDSTPTNAEWEEYYNNFLDFCRRWGPLLVEFSNEFKTIRINNN